MVSGYMIVISGNIGSDECAIRALKSVCVLSVTLLIVSLEIVSGFKSLTALSAGIFFCGNYIGRVLFTNRFMV